MSCGEPIYTSVEDLLYEISDVSILNIHESILEKDNTLQKFISSNNGFKQLVENDRRFRNDVDKYRMMFVAF